MGGGGGGRVAVSLRLQRSWRRTRLLLEDWWRGKG